MYRTTLAVLLLLFALANNAQAQDNWAAAACAGMGPKCTKYMAKKSGHCSPGLWMSQQPPTCRQAACAYCRRDNRRVTQPVCKRGSILKYCFNNNQPKPRSADAKKASKKKGKPAKKKKPTKKKPKKKPTKPKKKPTKPKKKPSSGKGTCNVFKGTNNKLVIPVNRLKLVSKWSRNSDGSMTWKKKGGSGIDKAGSGAICAKFMVPSSGTYYFTVVSKAPHPTEYNDAWFKLNAGFRLFRPQGNVWKKGGSGWFKGYQNRGRNQRADWILTIDFNGHQFISNNLVKGRVYQVCVSGRSAMYTIYNLIFIKCSGSSGCARGSSNIRSAMKSLPGPRC